MLSCLERCIQYNPSEIDMGDYILRVVGEANIIKINKEVGLMTRVVPKAGYEDIFEALNVKKAKLEEELRARIEKETELINNMIAEITDVVEEPDEVVEEITEEIVES